MIRSPLFYVGDKYKLVPQLLEYFPKKINKYIEPFYGGGSSQLQVNANSYLLNDIDCNVIKIHELLFSYRNNPNLFFSKLMYYIGKFNLSCSFIENIIPQQLKKQYPKTYYSKYNKDSYCKLKDHYNKNKDDTFALYLLLIYGFNHMIRFNLKGDFNLPVGNVDFNKNVYQALVDYFNLQKNRNIKYSSLDYLTFLKSVSYEEDDFIYLDPPYLISMSEYNKYWNEKNEIELYNFLDELHSKGIKFGITNLVCHKGKENNILREWSKKYTVEIINSNYISFNDNSIKDDSIEIYVHN